MFPNSVYLGARGSGKSTLAMADTMMRDRVCYVDITNTVSFPGETPVSRTADSLIRYMENRQSYRVIYRPDGSDGGPNYLGIPPKEDGGPTGVYAILAFMEKTGKLDTIVLDEYYSLTGQRQQDKPLLKHIHTSRHDMTSLSFIVHRPKQISPNIWGVLDKAFIFRVQRSIDAKALNDEWDNLGDIARKLKPYHYYAYDMIDGVSGPFLNRKG